MSRPLSIAMLSHLALDRAPTGAERSLALLACGLRRRGHRVGLVAPGRWALAPDLAEAGVEIEVIPSRSCWMSYYAPRPWPVALLKWTRCVAPQSAVRRIRLFLERFKPDVVHVNCLPHLAGAAAAASYGRPVVWHLREILPAGRRRVWWARKLSRHATSIVAVSEAVGSWVRDEGLGSKVRVVHNGVDVPRVSEAPAEARRGLGLPADGVLIGLYGQFAPHKGALAFVDAARRARREQPDLRFAIAGRGPVGFRTEVAAAAAASDLDGRVHLLEAQPSAERLIAATDVVCLATTTPDPLPRAVLEAMASSRPVAAFRSGGTGEMVVEGQTGLLVEPGDTAALAGAFVRLARNPDLRDSMGRAGARRARERFSMERHLDGMEAVFRSLA